MGLVHKTVPLEENAEDSLTVGIFSMRPSLDAAIIENRGMMRV